MTSFLGRFLVNVLPLPTRSRLRDGVPLARQALCLSRRTPKRNHPHAFSLADHLCVSCSTTAAPVVLVSLHHHRVTLPSFQCFISAVSATIKTQTRRLELPIFIDRLNGPAELLTQGFGEESFERDIELLGKHNRQARIYVVL